MVYPLFFFLLIIQKKKYKTYNSIDHSRTIRNEKFNIKNKIQFRAYPESMHLLTKSTYLKINFTYKIKIPITFTRKLYWTHTRRKKLCYLRPDLLYWRLFSHRPIHIGRNGWSLWTVSQEWRQSCPCSRWTTYCSDCPHPSADVPCSQIFPSPA